MSQPNNMFEVFYGSKSIMLEASDLYAAKLKGIQAFNVPKSKAHLVTPILIAVNGVEIVHRADF